MDTRTDRRASGALLILVASLCTPAVASTGDWRAETHTRSGYSPGVAADKLAALYGGRLGAR